MKRSHDAELRGFASDNYSGVHPEVLDALVEANGGHQIAYGEDDYTARLGEVVRAEFGERAEVFPVFNGTGANVTALTAMLPRWGAVVATGTAHIHTDEGGAPERVSGLKLLVVPGEHGKLTSAAAETEAWGWGDEHRPQPLALSITQATELGTVYTPEEVRALADFAHERGMAVHMDGARLANAAAALGVGLREAVGDVDVLSLGGTKNGLLGAEAVAQTVLVDQAPLGRTSRGNPATYLGLWDAIRRRFAAAEDRLRLGARDQPRPRHGLGDLPGLPHPARRGEFGDRHRSVQGGRLGGGDARRDRDLEQLRRG